ncbi:hypothetical protein JW826_06035 [Candidatus Woesearchaeota archaeon]|nr:hypothetical protein [Candidatus Woesearchaeota archaeon]
MKAKIQDSKAFFRRAAGITALLTAMIVMTIIFASFASARNDCVCGTCKSMDREGPSECNNPGGPCTVPNCGSYSNCELTCSNGLTCLGGSGICSTYNYVMWYYGLLNRCATFTSDFTGNAVCDFVVKTSCFGTNGAQQLGEKVRVKVNNVVVGTTDDPYCNEAAPPECWVDGPATKNFLNKVIPVTKGVNSLRIEGVEHSVGLAYFSMKCTRQSTETCGDGIVGPSEECEFDSQCEDHNPNTLNRCVNCQCEYPPIAVCGNGVIDPGEDCEKNSDCGAGKSCVQCKCTSTAYCGDGGIDPGEACELPGTNNNQYCAQSTTTCNGRRQGTRDSLGFCGLSCFCVTDSFQYSCVKGQCGANCAAHSDCNDGNPSTLDSCVDCLCRNEDSSFCGNSIIEEGEACEPPTSNNNPSCMQSTRACSGTKTGIRDFYGYCGLQCNCLEDQFQYTCVADSCGAECGDHSDCADGDPHTRDTCNNDCACVHEDMPYCGNDQIDLGEQCEEDSDCTPGKVCSSCRCVNAPYCGDGNTDPEEECDFGIKANGIPCVPDMNYSTCTYCNYTCEWATLTGGGCGNYKVEYKEECDEGSNNGVLCSPRCGDFCIYCRDNCKRGYVHGEDCYDNYTVPSVPCPDCEPLPGCYGEYCPPPVIISGGGGPRASICGDGVIGFGEECDNGYDNGIACSPAYNGDCAYCDANCEKVILEGSPCARAARPWDQAVLNPCRTLVYPLAEARLDLACDGGGRVVTREANLSDNSYARQGSCLINASYIYLDWTYILPQQLKNLTLFLEHREENSFIKVEYFNGSAWLPQCSIKRADRDIKDSCVIRGVNDFRLVPLRIKILREGSGAFENLDQAYLAAVYCNGPATCGDFSLDPGEECDDGNLDSGDGCDEFCSRELIMCSDWGECIGGKQVQNCYYGNFLKTHVKGCGSLFFFENFLVIILIILLVLLVLLFLFFPVIYLALNKRKKEKEYEKKKH